MGGAEILLLKLCHFLKEQNFPITVCALFGGCLEAEFHALGIPLHILGEKRYSFRLIQNYIRLIMRHDFDILHTHIFHATLLGRSLTPRRIKIVTTEHNTTDLVQRDWPWGALYRWSTQRNSCVVAVSKSVQDLLVTRTSLSPKMIKLISSGINFSHYASQMPSRFSQFSSKKNRGDCGPSEF